MGVTGDDRGGEEVAEIHALQVRAHMLDVRPAVVRMAEAELPELVVAPAFDRAVVEERAGMGPRGELDRAGSFFAVASLAALAALPIRAAVAIGATFAFVAALATAAVGAAAAVGATAAGSADAVAAALSILAAGAVLTASTVVAAEPARASSAFTGATLGDAAFRRATRRGERLSPAAALAYALEDRRTPAGTAWRRRSGDRARSPGWSPGA